MLTRIRFLIICLHSIIASASAQQKPNVVIILADDLDAIVTPQFFPEVLPIVDSLKNNGLDFTNSFTPMSICCPSRAALLSGMYGHKTEVLRNGNTKGGWKYFKDDEPNALPVHLANAGYRTAMIGKYMNGYKKKKNKTLPLPFGWTDGSVMVSKPLPIYRGYNYDLLVWDKAEKANDSTWTASNSKIEHFGKLEKDYSTDVLTGKALDFIEQTEVNDTQPFFLYLTPTPPHFPLPPAPRYEQKAKARWLNEPVPQTPNYFNDYGKLATEKERNIPLDKSLWLQSNWKKIQRQQKKGRFYYGLAYDGKMPKEIKSFLQAVWYYRMASLYALNDMMERVIKSLKEKGEWDNTLFIFTSDNGFHLGSKGLYHKGTPYEEAIRVPLIITGGDSLRLNTPGKVEEWVINLDLMPTLLELTGSKIPDDIDGKSILPIITRQTGGSYQPRESFIMEYISPGGTDFIFGGPTLNIKLFPSPLLDRPSYNAIRIIKEVEVNGIKEQKVFKYIEWEKNYGMINFRRKLEVQHPKMMAKIAAGNKTILRKKAKAEAVETELYNLTDDPYEMDNLLYYKPDEYKALTEQLKAKLYSEMKKQKDQ